MHSFTYFKDLIKNLNHGVITTHIYPDADGIGSEVALGLALRKLNKNVVCVNESPLVERYDYLDTKDMVISVEEYKKKYQQPIDLLIVMDTHTLDRLGPNMQKVAQNAKKVFFIDHHPCSEELKEKHCIDTSYAATGELVGELIEKMGIPLDINMALPLYISILIDTNSFRYPTVSSRTHRFIAKLIDIGVRPHQAYNSIYGGKKIAYFNLAGSLLSSVQTIDDNSVAWLALSEKNRRFFKVNHEDTLTFINNLLVLDNIKIACMFTQEKDRVKISLRTLENIDVAYIAGKLGGGGHHHSAATIIKGSFNEVIKNSVGKITDLLKNDPKASYKEN